MLMKNLLRLLVALCLAAPSLLLAVDAPNVVNYQGKLLNASGVAVADGTYTVAFRIYPAATGTTLLWGASYTVVVSGGYFNVILGEGGAAITGATYTSVADALGSTTTPYLGLTITADTSGPVNNPSEISPRLRFLSSPYALVSEKAKQADSATTATTASQLNGVNAANFFQPGLSNSTSINGPLTINAATTLKGGVSVSGGETVNDTLTVNGTLFAAKTSGGGFVPVGGIIMWSGNSGNLPDGWALCNGSGTYLLNGVSTAIPNLQDKFIVGSGHTYSTAASGGASSATLTTDNLPDFRFKFKDSYHAEHYSDNPGDNGPDGLGGGYDQVQNAWYGSGDTDHDNYYLWYVWRYSLYWRSGTSTAAGTPTAVNTLPPYYALAYIIRIK